MAVNLKDSVQRQTLSNLLEKGLNNPSGFVLPLKWMDESGKWASCVWEFRRKHCYLIPGNSPIGLRLPLESLPKTAKNKREQPIERSTFEDLPPLGEYHISLEERYGTISPSYKATERKLEEEEEYEKDNLLFEVETFSTALCVEEREGIIYVFLPPTDYFETYLDMIASVENTAEKLQCQ